MVTIVWSILTLVFGLLIGVVFTVFYYRSGISKEQQNLLIAKKESELECENLLEDAKKTGESRKRELLLQAKDEIHRAKINLEREVKLRKDQFKRDQQRLDEEKLALKDKENSLERRHNQEDQRSKNLDEKEKDFLERENKLQILEEQKLHELEKVASLNMEEARKIVLDTATQSYRLDAAQRLRQIEEETKEKADAMAKEMIVTAIHRYASDYVSEITVSVVNLPNDEMKGRIIGREGRNIRTFETISGVDLIIDDTPEAVVLSCFNPIRREIAKIALEKLLQDGRIHPSRIEEMLEKAEHEIESVIKKEGDRVALETGIMGLSPEILRLLGRMKYRTSYGQNQLQHSIEVCWLSGIMAAELGLDVQLAKRAGLLHDIGKAVDFEMEGTHVELGVEIAERNHEHPIVINSIASHHGDTEATHPISFLVAAADALSAARPGARRENLETYIHRVQKLEEIASSFEGVEKSFAIQAGREIRVIVKPDQMSDEEMVLKAREISKRIENELNYPGQIKVNMIRESRVIDYAR